MSLILDALNRADSERKNQAPVPDLNTHHRPLVLEPDETSYRRRWLFVAGGLICCVFMFLGYWFALVRTSATPVSTLTAPSSQVAINSPVPAGKTAASLSSYAAASAANSVAREPINSALKAAEVDHLYAQEAVAQAAPTADVSQLYDAEESTGSETIVDPFASLPGAQATPSAVEIEREPARTFDNTLHIQDFNDLPWNTKQKMPTISYQRHDYLAGGVSSVVINGQTLGIGNIVATGQFVVQDILVDGVVLKQGDKTFKLRALNGWINM